MISSVVLEFIQCFLPIPDETSMITYRIGRDNREKLHNIIIMVFMSAIFGMFAQFINVHMVIYRNLTPNLTKGQKRVKNCPECQKTVKIKNNHRNNFFFIISCIIHTNHI